MKKRKVKKEEVLEECPKCGCSLMTGFEVPRGEYKCIATEDGSCDWQGTYEEAQEYLLDHLED